MSNRPKAAMTKRTSSISTRRRAGFTLTELLVAIGVVSILTVAVGQLFRSISGVVGAGVATSQIDQLARSIERQMRDDFKALNRMAPEETFIAIRMREIGDRTRDMDADDPNEVPLYLKQEDRDFDQQNDLTPYEVVSPTLRSRAITRRVDDMVFLAPASTGTEYPSFQLDQVKNSANFDESDLKLTASSPFARIYIGHALRPAPDLDFEYDPDDPTVRQTPTRFLIPDGDFGSRRPDNNRFADISPANINNGRVAGLNEFAGEWMLARQAALLFGGTAAGVTPPSVSRGVSVAPIGNGREFAPFIRDAESFARMGSGTPSDNGAGVALNQVASDDEIANRLFDPEYPEPRMLGWGRTDIIAQDITDVKRWIEGQDPTPAGASTPILGDAGAYSTGYFNATSTAPATGNDHPDYQLWARVDQSVAESAANVLRENLRGLRSAVAGCFVRPQQTATPPAIERRPPDQTFQTGDALMDTHAVLAARCSNFEIAWSDGSTATRNIDLDGDAGNGPEVRQGDVIWFDISLTDPTDPTTRSTYRWWWDNHRRRVDFKSDPGTGPIDPSRDIDFPEVIPVEADQLLHIRERDNFTWNGDDGSLNNGVYNVDFTGGEPDEGLNQRTEYLAIWPFREPTGVGDYGAAWDKQILIRVRMTLHDEQLRLEGGKDFEFIFTIDPGSG